jgi:hypothetical protein
MSEGALVTAMTEHEDVQKWWCEGELDKLWIPQGLKRATVDELEELNNLNARRGVTRLLEKGVLRTIGEVQRGLLLEEGVEPETRHIEKNLLLYGGASVQWQTLIGNGTTTAGQALTYFNNAQAAIGVGDSTTAAAATQTNLQASTNKLRVAMDATYPSHTDGTTSGAASIVFRSTFGTSQANFAWQEWVIANSATDGTGRCLNRKVESLGTKTSASTWTLTLTLSLA